MRADRLETEGLVRPDDRSFALTGEEEALVTRAAGDGRAKNISLQPSGEVRGAGRSEAEGAGPLMARFRAWSEGLVAELWPAYAQALIRGRTSFRPRTANAPAASPRKDDTRLHIDAFASQPTGGARILRVFANVSPNGEPRVWRLGEAFEAHARRWLPRLRWPLPAEAWLLERLGITRARRTPYDFLMLSLHDHAKLDTQYQRQASAEETVFPAGSSWVVFTDQTPHAAVSGRLALEQTFYLPVAAMAAPETSPLRILERLTGRGLA